MFFAGVFWSADKGAVTRPTCRPGVWTWRVAGVSRDTRCILLRGSGGHTLDQRRDWSLKLQVRLIFDSLCSAEFNVASVVSSPVLLCLTRFVRFFKWSTAWPLYCGLCFNSLWGHGMGLWSGVCDKGVLMWKTGWMSKSGPVPLLPIHPSAKYSFRPFQSL